MSLEQEIPAVRSKAQVEKIVKWAGEDKKRFGLLMKYFLNGESDLARKSAWIAGHCVEQHPVLAVPWLRPLLSLLRQPGVDNALKRNALRILHLSDIPHPLQGTAIDLCFKLLSSLDEPIAVRAYSISVISKIAKGEPGLKKELELVVRQMLPYGTPAFRSQAKRVLKKSGTEKSALSPEDEWEMIQEWLHHDVK